MKHIFLGRFLKTLVLLPSAAGSLTASGASAATNPLPGKGFAEHDFFYAGEAKEENMYIVKAGHIAWSYSHPGRGEISDAILLSNGNVLFCAPIRHYRGHRRQEGRLELRRTGQHRNPYRISLR